MKNYEQINKGIKHKPKESHEFMIRGKRRIDNVNVSLTSSAHYKYERNNEKPICIY